MRTTTQRTILAAVIAISAATAQADTSIFDFNGNLNATSGGGTLAFLNTTQNVVAFGTTTAFGISNINGVNAQVLQFPAFTQAQGLLFDPNVFGNGGSGLIGGNPGYINQYSMGFDVLVPNNNQWFSFWNTSATNTNDGEAFIRPSSSGGGIGISGVYHGTVNANTWYRFFFTVNQNTNVMTKYINGVQVGTTTISGGTDGRWSMYSDADNIPTYLLTDDNGDTTAGYINSFYFADRILSGSEVSGFGAANAAGFVSSAAPEAGTLALCGLVLPVLGLTARRRRK